MDELILLVKAWVARAILLELVALNLLPTAATPKEETEGPWSFVELFYCLRRFEALFVARPLDRPCCVVDSWLSTLPVGI